MANTLELGNGKWATGKDTVLAYNDLNNNFKPLPFDFSRASSATVVNKAGLIETVGSGEPRIDFLGNTKGALKLEPQRTNVIPYSEDFSNAAWILADVTRTLNYGITPEGLTNSVLITEGSGNAQHRAYSSSSSSSSIHTLSAFVKNSNGSRQAYIDMGPVTGFFNFDTETMYSALGTTSVEKWANGWYRISITSTSAFTPVATYLGLGNSNTETFQGNGTSSIEFFAPQLEQGSYATSYIPTQGSTVTRVKDLCVNTVPENIVNKDEMTLYCEFEYLGGGDTIPISVHNSSSSVIWLAINNNFTIYGANYYSGVFNGSSTSTTVLLPNTKYKVAYRTKSGDSVLYLDGILEASSNDAISNPNTLNKVELGSHWNGTNQNPNLKIIDAKCYNSGLSNSELQQLTTI